jgi:hypothetical protein
MKIANKLTAVFFLFTLSITTFFYIGGIFFQRKHFEEIAHEQIKEVKASFQTLATRDTKMLFSVMELIVRDPALKALYLKKNREGLYKRAEDLFRGLSTRKPRSRTASAPSV